ncbi:unnamed protein product [Lactuca virosa]|uniref:Uncharacterized protein n=1 Tax=Lactuca virosa TaxID=75947 RepID=A0AAU9MR48_9ASTR|nr:unnamed protein product [Lactuca virosa]
MSLSVYCCKYVHDNPEDITKEEACLAANHVKGPDLTSSGFSKGLVMKVNEFATHVVGSLLTEASEGATNLHVDHGVGDQDLSMAMNETSGSSLIEERLCEEPINEFVQSYDIVVFNKIYFDNAVVAILLLLLTC